MSSCSWWHYTQQFSRYHRRLRTAVTSHTKQIIFQYVSHFTWWQLDHCIQEASDNTTEDNSGFWSARVQEAAYSLLAWAKYYVSVPACQAYLEQVFSACWDLCATRHNRAIVGLKNQVFAKIKHKHGCIVWNAHNTVLGEEVLLIYIVPVCYVKTGRYGKT